jgi:epoxyqueuosine reductase
MNTAERILLHTCCAPCATACTERLIASGSETLLFFSNSNIYPEEEYLKRLENAVKLAAILNLKIQEDRYDHEEWLRHIRGLEDEPEQGRRCMKCFGFSLSRAARAAEILNFPAFTTTLTVSRHKPSQMIFEAGKIFPAFKPFDFKKQNGYSRSIELSKVYGLYRQNYCGCEFSSRQGKGLTG